MIAPWCVTMTVIACLAECPALAAPGYTIGIVADVAHDNNIFRIDDTSPVAAGACRSDTIGTIRGRAGYTLDDGAWRGSINGRAFHQKFKCNDGLDNTGFDGELSLDSPDIGPVNFTLTGSASRQLSSFSDVRSFTGNRQTRYRLDGRTSLKITPEIRIVVDPTFLASTNTSATLRQIDYHRYGAGAGLGYFSPLGNSIVAKVTRTYVKGLNARPGSFNGAIVDLRTNLRNTSYDLDLVYVLSPFTSVRGTLSYIRRDDRRPVNANFSGFVGNVTANFMSDSGFAVGLGAGRQLASQTSLFVDGTRTDNARLTLGKTLSAASRLNGEVSFLRQHYSLDPLLGRGLGGNDKRLRAQLSAAIRVVDRFDLGPHVEYEKRMSGSIYQPYNSFGAGLSLTYAFGTAQ